MLKRFFSACLACCFIVLCAGNNTASALSAKSAVVIHAETGEILFAHNAEQKLPMASTTKIMTALLLAEEPDLTKTLVTTKEMVTVEGSSMGLLEGDTVSYYALLVGMLLASGNDAANTTAIALAGSPQAFAERMNAKARQIGMKNTNFVTPSGLDDEQHYSTAYDMALLGAYAMNNPVFAKVASSKSIAVEYGNPPYRRTLTNHNRLLSLYDKAIGVKTGFTKKSGRCLVSAAENENGRVVAVTLNASNDWNDHMQLLDQGLAALQKTTLQYDEQMQIDIAGGTEDRIALKADPVVLSLTANSKSKIKRHVTLEPFCYAPVPEGQAVGSVDYYYEGKKIAAAPIRAAQAVDAQAPMEQHHRYFRRLLDLLAAIGV